MKLLALEGLFTGMGKIDDEARAVIESLLGFIAPESMSAKERAELARKAGLSPNTLRTNLRRKTINADTLIRLLLARGISPKDLIHLPQNRPAVLPAGEERWLSLGRKLNAEEKSEFADLVEVMRTRLTLQSKKRRQ